MKKFARIVSLVIIVTIITKWNEDGNLSFSRNRKLLDPSSELQMPDQAQDADEWHDEEKLEVSIGKQNSITWLLSFPNSGTSYTVMNTMSTSGLSTATNYGTELLKMRYFSGTLEPIQSKGRLVGSNGPWRYDLTRPLPPGRVLCKTHCTGYDDRATVEKSVFSLRSFQNGCTETYKKEDMNVTGEDRKTQRLNYEMDGLVDSVIHLI